MSSLSSAGAEIEVGTRLPELRGEYLSGRRAILPNDASGRVTLLLFGFTYRSRFAVEAWTGRFRGEFEANPEVTFYEIPMIGGIARLAKWFIDRGMRRGTPEADREHAITVYGGIEPWKQWLGVKEEDVAYLVILDRNGNAGSLRAGPFDETQYQTLAAEVRKLVGGQ